MVSIVEKFIKKRFPNEADENYKDTWKRRFRDGTEWAYADRRSRGILLELAPDYYGRKAREEA